MTLPLVSVAIPAYKHEKYIHACLTSIYQQTYPEIELIVIDDGSPDDTFGIAQNWVAQYGARFRRVVLLRQENQGVSATSNAVIRAADGKWVHLLGSDDILYPTIVARTQEALALWDCPELALVHADIDIIDDVGNKTSGHRLRKNRPAPGIDHEAWRWLFWGKSYIFNPTVALRRDAFLAIGGFNTRLSLEDLDCWLRLTKHFPIARIPETLAGYRQHPSNSSRKRLMMLSAVLETYGNFISANNDCLDVTELKKHFQKNLKTTWRRLRSQHLTQLPTVVAWLIYSFIKTPTAANYYELSQFIKNLDEKYSYQLN